MNTDELSAERAKERVSEIRSILEIAFFKMAYPISVIFLVPDWVLIRDKFKYLILDRGSVFLVGFLCISLSRRVRTERDVQLVCLLGVVLVSLSVDAAIWIASAPQYYNYVGLLLVTMCSSFFIPFLPRYWIGSLVGTYLPYFFGWLLFFREPSDSPIFFSAGVYIVSTIIISYFMARFNEGLRRKDLSSRLALKNEIQSRDKIILEKTKQSVELEFKVREAKIMADIAKHVSHDIRSPISAMNLVIGSLKELPDAKKNLLSEAVKRINDIANDLLSKSREMPKVSNQDLVAHQMHELRALIDQVVAEKRIQHQDEDLEFTVISEPQRGVVRVRLEPIKFKRIVSNLLNNAIEAMLDKGSIEIAILQTPSELVVQVKDNGRGVPLDILPKIMVEGFTYGKIGGNGLGLSTARREIESWSGSMGITSAPDAGTTVTIRLPIA